MLEDLLLPLLIVLVAILVAAGLQGIWLWLWAKWRQRRSPDWLQDGGLPR